MKSKILAGEKMSSKIGETIDIAVATLRKHTAERWLNEYKGDISGKTNGKGFFIKYELSLKQPYLKLMNMDEEEFFANIGLEATINNSEIEEKDKYALTSIIIGAVYPHLALFEKAFGSDNAPFKASPEALRYIPGDFHDNSDKLTEENVRMLLSGVINRVDRNRVIAYLAELHPTLESEYKMTLSGELRRVLEKYLAPVEALNMPRSMPYSLSY